MKKKVFAVLMVLAIVAVLGIRSQIMDLKLTDDIIVRCLPVGDKWAVMWTNSADRVVVYEYGEVIYNNGEVRKFPSLKKWEMLKIYQFYVLDNQGFIPYWFSYSYPPDPKPEETDYPPLPATVGPMKPFYVVSYIEHNGRWYKKPTVGVSLLDTSK